MTQPVVPQWLIEAGDQMADTWIPLIRMPGVPGPVKVSLTGLVASAYVAGWDAAREQFAAGVPAGARIITAEQWETLRQVLCDATGWPMVDSAVHDIESDAPASIDPPDSTEQP
jgi:hypothetical protein